MLGNLLLATAALQVGPFYQQKDDYHAVRPIVAAEEETTDVLWPIFTSHRDWWRFCLLMSFQQHPEEDSWQFAISPIWYNGRDTEKGSYAALFPIGGYHPHIAMMYDVKFALWPLWTQYKMPRPSTGEWLETNTILFPFVSWRSDGAWSFWPIYGVNYQRESTHRYVCWPFVTWADYREDRDTAGEGSSWMVWPFYGRVRRAREKADFYLPPLFSYSETTSRLGDGMRLRCPWPFFEYEKTPARKRISVWPLYERVSSLSYTDGSETAHVTRFGWKLVELYDDETRVFPFYSSGRDHFRLWPFYESETKDEQTCGRFLALVPIRWVPAVDRNWSKFWTLYERKSCPLYTDHSLLWGIIRWRTNK